MQFADLIDEQDAAVRFRDRARLRLRNARDAHRARPLIDRIVHGADKRIGDAPFVETRGRGVDFRKLGVETKGRRLVFLRFLQNDPRRRRFAHTRRPIDDDVLRIAAA